MDVTEISSLLLGATKLDEFNGRAYSIGPAGFRVGFCFQQRRALNVAGALNASARFASDTRIAIVGGGLAGTSTYLALRGLGFTTCRLYEASTALMNKQSFASHRILHPSYNDWPIAEKFSATTSFPFLNWFTSSADAVTQILTEEWEQQHAGRLPLPRISHRVEDATPHADGDKVVLDILAKHEDGTWNTVGNSAFDLVIFASGFGIETTPSSSAEGSYWTPDKVDIYRETETEKVLYVSGIGDGGLMDFLRLCFDERHVHSLPIFTISELRPAAARRIREPGEYTQPPRSAWEERIFKAEEEAAQLLPELPVARTSKFGEDVENNIAELLSDRYQEIADDLPEGLIAMLERSRVKMRPIKLIGNLKKPFSLDVAPINKLLIAYVLSKDPDLYIQGWLTNIDDEFLVETPSGDNFTVPNRQAIVRHGARPPVYDISPTFEEKNKSIYRSLANLTEEQFDQKKFCEHIKDHASTDIDDHLFRIKRAKLALEFGKMHFSSNIGSAYKGEPDSFHFYFDRDMVDASEVIQRTGDFPHQLFGVPLLPAVAAPMDDGLGR